MKNGLKIIGIAIACQSLLLLASCDGSPAAAGADSRWTSAVRNAGGNADAIVLLEGDVAVLNRGGIASSAINNSGRAMVNDSAGSVTIRAGGVFDNAGGVALNVGGGVFRNYYRVENAGGIFINMEGGVFDNEGAVFNNEGGVIHNDGIINNEGGAIIGGIITGRGAIVGGTFTGVFVDADLDIDADAIVADAF